MSQSPFGPGVGCPPIHPHSSHWKADGSVCSGLDRPEGAFVCPACGMVSYHPQDLANGYCGRCHAFTAEPSPAVNQP